jgi:deazaflavin-dependent oxidoreductase (nitroreductase family)
VTVASGGATKRRIARLTTNRFVNPLVRGLHRLGITGGTALLETTGRKTHRPRQTPVGNGLRGEEFWIITEHGRHSSYVKNIEANPRVRVKAGRTWFDGTAHILDDDDPRERMRWLGRRGNDTAVRLVGTEHLVIRVDLDE